MPDRCTRRRREHAGTTISRAIGGAGYGLMQQRACGRRVGRVGRVGRAGMPCPQYQTADVAVRKLADGDINEAGRLDWR